ncbi:MAG TPA: hypothetical protein ENN60_02125 [archaeon]|nr:hypothetical protein [archaeon]
MSDGESAERQIIDILPGLLIGLALFGIFAILAGRVEGTGREVASAILLVRFEEDSLTFTSVENLEKDRIKIYLKFRDGTEIEEILSGDSLKAYSLQTYVYPVGELKYVIVYYLADVGGGRYEWLPVDSRSYGGGTEDGR